MISFLTHQANIITLKKLYFLFLNFENKNYLNFIYKF